MSDRELMQQALDALQNSGKDCGKTGKRAAEFLRRKVCDALRARLAEPETPAPTLFRVNLLRLCPALTHEQIDELAAMARLAEPDDEPYCWVVSGCSTRYTGPYAEDCARDEAKRIGRGGKAFPLYTRPAARNVQPLTKNQVMDIVEGAGYTGAQAKADFINGLRHAERAHGITGDSHD